MTERIRITTGMLGCLLLAIAMATVWHSQILAQTPIQGGFSGGRLNNGFSSPQTTSGPVGSGPTRIASLPNASTTAGSSNAAGIPPSLNAMQSNANADNTPGKIPVRNLLQVFHEGGILMYPIALCSFVMFVFTFERLVSLRAGRVIPRPFVRRLLEQLEQQQIDREEAIALCEKNSSPISQIMLAAAKKYGRPAVEVEQAAIDAGERVSNYLRRHLRLLNSISNVTPLLGLLGTVLGMIEAFNAIATADAMGRPELLAGGIGTALITTAAGLLVAIPAYLAYMYFLGRADRLVMEMDRYVQQVIDSISAEGLSENASRSRARSRKNAA
jgi:biopolymer transport protein ExbB